MIRIARDFMVFGDLAPAYSNVFPDILEPHVTEDQFRVVVAHVNEGLHEAFDPWNVWNWVDAVVGLLTLWLIEELVSTHCKRVLRRVEIYLEERNRELEASGQKAMFVPLRRTGYMNVSAAAAIVLFCTVLTRGSWIYKSQIQSPPPAMRAKARVRGLTWTTRTPAASSPHSAVTCRVYRVIYGWAGPGWAVEGN